MARFATALALAWAIAYPLPAQGFPLFGGAGRCLLSPC